GRGAADACPSLSEGDAPQRRRCGGGNGRTGGIMADEITLGNTGFLAEVERLSGTPVSACYQCHKCTSGCPIGPDMDLLPSQVMRLTHLGLEGEVLESESIWLCASCEACTTRCPMGIDIAAVMDTMRILAIERKADIPDSHGKQFNRSFLGSV